MSDKIYTTVPVSFLDKNYDVKIRIDRADLVTAVVHLLESKDKKCIGIWAEKVEERNSS